MRPETLSDDLRHGGGRYLNNRRAITGLSLTAAASMAFIALYQLGIIPHLPEPPLRYLDADKVDASREAYAKLDTPDAVLGFGSYAATMLLAAASGKDRHELAPLLPIAMAAKVAIDAVNAGKLTVDQWTKQRAFCLWCLLAATATFAMVPLAVPEAMAAARNLGRHGRSE